MFALLRSRIVVRGTIACPIIGKALEQFKSKYSSISQICGNLIGEASSKARAKDTIASLTKLLKSYEFTDPQIAKFCTKFPIKPSYDPINVIKPKLDFLLDIGFSNTQLAKFISSNHFLMKLSLENRIKSNVLLLKDFYGTEEFLIRALFTSSCLLKCKLECNFFPNVRTLTNQGVPLTKIVKFASKYPRGLQFPAKKFRKAVQLVVSKGFNPCSTLFCVAVHLVVGTNPATWKKKMSLYRNLGWSEEDAVSAFFRYPGCMGASENKIKRVMEFFVNERQCEPSFLAENPVLINLSLEKRVKPRCLVIDMLLKKQLVKKRYAFQYLISNKDFLEKYVVPYQDLAPEILHAYNGLDRCNQCPRCKLLKSILDVKFGFDLLDFFQFERSI